MTPFLIVVLACLSAGDAMSSMMRREPDTAQQPIEEETRKPELMRRQSEPVELLEDFAHVDQAQEPVLSGIGYGMGLSSPQPAVVGGVLQLMARIFTAVGLILQRAASTDDRKTLLWQTGLAIYLVFTVPDMLSLLLAPQAVLTMISAVEPILVLALVWLLVPEDAAILSSKHTVGTAMCVAAAGLGSLQGSALAATHNTSSTNNHFWSISQGEGRLFLFSESGAHRLRLYLYVAAPLLVFLIYRAFRFRYNIHVRTGIFSCHQFYLVTLITIASLSLAFNRFAFEVLRVALEALHWEPSAAMYSPTVLGTAVIAVICLLSCVYHVCQSVLEAPPHIFVPVYFAMSKIVQLFQSMVIMQEYRGQPEDKLLTTFACTCVSLAGVMCLLVMHFVMFEAPKALPANFFDEPGKTAAPPLLDCVERRPFDSQ